MSAATERNVEGWCTFCRARKHEKCVGHACRCDNPACLRRRGIGVVPDPPELPDGMVFEEPPTGGRGRSGADYGTLLRALTEHVGRWVRVRVFDGKTSAPTTAAHLRKGRYDLPAGRFEFAGKANKPPGQSSLYARYLGPEDKS